jgi:hypothetical protein
MKTIYIAGPFRGADGFAVHMNVVRAEAAMYALIDAALKQGTEVAVCCPHSMTKNLDRTFTDQYWLDATLEWLDRCDAILMLDGWEASEGAKGEEARARATGKPVLLNLPTALAWLQGESVGLPVG